VVAAENDGKQVEVFDWYEQDSGRHFLRSDEEMVQDLQVREYGSDGSYLFFLPLSFSQSFIRLAACSFSQACHLIFSPNY
jgi:hypothetical protein